MLADIIPAKARKTVYTVLATLIGLEAIFDLVPNGWETKMLAALTVCGFALANGNAPKD